MLDKKLSGKVALVTGASRGIGAAIARRLADDGADVAITYSSSRAKADELVKSIEAGGTRGLAILADNADADAVKRAVNETVATLGRIDILVNNAGLIRLAPIHEVTLAHLDEMLAVNVRGVFVAIQEASRHMTEGGRIITIGSVNADRVPFANLSVYAMTKAALAGLTRGLAYEFAPRGITINNVQPGPVNTESNPADGPMSEMIHSFMALKRHGEGHEIGAMVSYLASPEAAFVTGASLTIDGGFSA